MPPGAIPAALYVALCATLALPVWDVFSKGTDRTWLILVPVVVAHLVLGAGTKRVAALAAPIGVAALVLEFIARDALVLTMTIFAIPFGVGLVAIGLALPRRSIPVLVALALATVGYATWETVSFDGAPYLPSAEAQALPRQQSTLNGLCGHFGLPQRERARLERQLLALGRTARRSPDAKVRTTFAPADDPGIGREDLRVHQLYENQLDGLCEPYASRLRAAAGP